MVLRVKKDKSVVYVTLIKNRIKRVRAIIQPLGFMGTHKTLARVGPSGRPIPTPSICIYN